MHIYYYYKDGYYFVMNEKGVLEKYSVKNNIEMILKLENIIQYFAENLEEENTKFYFKPYQESTPIEKTNLLQIFSMFSLFQYTIFQENTIPILAMETTIFNIVDELYKEKKIRIQKEESLLEELYKDLLIELNKKLELLKEISVYQKEIVPLSELDEKANKTYLNQEKEIDEYCTDIRIQFNLELYPENIFYNNKYDELINAEIRDKKELEFQRKIKKVKEQLQKEFPEEVALKLKSLNNQLIMHYTFLITNGCITLVAAVQLIKEYFNISFLNKYHNHIFNLFIILSIASYYFYEKAYQEIEEPTLKLKKEK